MKILYFITTSNWGGASKHLYELCKYEAGKGNEIYLVTGNRGALLNKINKIQGVRTCVISSVKRNISPLNDIKSVFAFRKIIKKLHPDIVHLHSSKAGVIGRLAAISTNTKVVFTVHGWSFTDGVRTSKKKLYRSIERIMSRFTDLFICVSKFDLDIGYRDHVLSDKCNAVVIHNGSKYIRRKKKVVINKVDPLRLIMVARFSEQKNQLGLLKALCSLRSQNIKLSFIGDGPTLNKAKQFVNHHHLNDKVDFLGFKNNIGMYLDQNDVFILSTFYEGLPISIIEAMSHGLPIIASDVGGNRELVFNNKNGFLVKDKNELENAIKQFLDRKKIKKMGEESYEIFLKGFLLENCLEKIHTEYLLLLK